MASLPTLVVDTQSCSAHNALFADPARPCPPSVLDVPARTDPILRSIAGLLASHGLARVVERSARVAVASAAFDASVGDAYWDHCNVLVAAARADPKGYVWLDADHTTVVSADSLKWALRAAGCLVEAVALALKDGTNVYALYRPPGHHNSANEDLEQSWDQEEGRPGNFVFGAHGGCLLPNIPIALRTARQGYRRRGEASVSSEASSGIADATDDSSHASSHVGNHASIDAAGAADASTAADTATGTTAAADASADASAAPLRPLRPLRAVVVDLDAHFGDGTAMQFWEDHDVLTLSMHLDQHEGNFFPFLQGGADECDNPLYGGAMLNLPLPAGAGDAEALAALRGVMGRCVSFAPDIVVIACG